MRLEKKQEIGFGWLSAAGIFLCNPIVAGVDVLPDLFGYLLICIGLYRLSDLDAHMLEAQRRFRILLLVGGGELAALYFIYGVIGRVVRDRPTEINVYEFPVLILLSAFVFAILRLYFLIPAWRELFAGMDSLGRRQDNRELCCVRRNRTSSERMTVRTTAFAIFSSVLSVLPELTILTSFENDKGNPVFPFDWYRFITLFRLFAVVLGLIIGIVWLVFVLRYFGRARRARAWVQALVTRYRKEILPQTGMLTVRRITAAFALLGIGMIFTVNLRLNYYTVLPGAIFALFCSAGLCMLGEHAKQKRTCFAISAVLAAVSAAEWIANRLYLADYLPEASAYYPQAYQRFLVVRLLDGAEALVTIALVLALLRTLYGTVRTHTEVNYGTPGSEALSEAATERLHGEFGRRMMINAGLFSAAAVINLADAVFRLRFPWIWAVSFILSVIAIWQFFAMLNELNEQIHVKYQSDGTNKSL